MSVFNITNDVLMVDTFKNVFQRRNSEVFKPDVPEFWTIQKYMLHCQYCVKLVSNLDDQREVPLQCHISCEKMRGAVRSSHRAPTVCS